MNQKTIIHSTNKHGRIFFFRHRNNLFLNQSIFERYFLFYFYHIYSLKLNFTVSQFISYTYSFSIIRYIYNINHFI